MSALDDRFISSEAILNGAPQADAVSDLDTLSEDACALAFVDNYLDDLRFDHDAGAWFGWDGQRWKRDGTARAFAYARALIRSAASTR